jgi:Tfp pilus assembly pilus retraction ATPase PilT
MDIAELLTFSVKNNASDLHLSAGLPPMIRVDGDIRRINIPALEHKEVHSLIYDIMNDKQRRDYEEFLETDFHLLCRELPVFVSMHLIRKGVPVRYSEPFPPRYYRWKILMRQGFLKN